MTYDERKIIQHTLGLDRSRVVYRNHFIADPRHQDMPILERCVAHGWMVRETSGLSSDFTFRVTAAGKQALIEATKP